MKMMNYSGKESSVMNLKMSIKKARSNHHCPKVTGFTRMHQIQHTQNIQIFVLHTPRHMTTQEIYYLLELTSSILGVLKRKHPYSGVISQKHKPKCIMVDFKIESNNIKKAFINNPSSRLFRFNFKCDVC